MKEEAIHHNVAERSDAGSVFERGGKTLVFVVGPAVVFLVVGWLIGLPFLR